MEDLMMEDIQRKDEDMKTWQGISIGLLIGVVAGALVGMLYAPKKGKYLRADISRRTGEVLDDASHILRDTIGRATSGVRTLTRGIGAA